MVCAPVRSIIPSLKLGDYLSVQAHKPCSISHIHNMIQPHELANYTCDSNVTYDELVDRSCADILRWLGSKSPLNDESIEGMDGVPME